MCSQTFAKRRVLVGLRAYVALLESGGVGVDALSELKRTGGRSCVLRMRVCAYAMNECILRSTSRKMQMCIQQ